MINNEEANKLNWIELNWIEACEADNAVSARVTSSNQAGLNVYVVNKDSDSRDCIKL